MTTAQDLIKKSTLPTIESQPFSCKMDQNQSRKFVTFEIICEKARHIPAQDDFLLPPVLKTFHGRIWNFQTRCYFKSHRLHEEGSAANEVHIQNTLPQLQV